MVGSLVDDIVGKRRHYRNTRSGHWENDFVGSLDRRPGQLLEGNDMAEDGGRHSNLQVVGFSQTRHTTADLCYYYISYQASS